MTPVIYQKHGSVAVFTLAREGLPSTRESTVRTDSVTQFRETERNDLFPRSTVLLNLQPADTYVLAGRSRAKCVLLIVCHSMIEKG